MTTSSSDLLANLSPAKRLLLEKRQRGEKITSSIPALVRIPRNGGGLPLSYAQQRLWFIDQLAPGRAAYNNPGGMRLAGPLNIDALRNSLKEIVRRHEALRTRFIAVKGEPQQVIDETTSLDIPIVELNGTPAHERETEARRLARKEAARSFDLEHGPVFRASLLRLSDQDHILLLNMHHIVSDGWSAEVLLREFAAVYAALSTGRPSSLPELPVQYADYSVWQRSWLKGAVLEDKVSYWKRQLVGFETAEIPTDWPRPAVQGQSGSTLEVHFDNKFTDGVRELSRGQGATLYMVLLGALQVLIYRYSGQRDVLIGSPVAGRTQSQVEGLIGLFVNTLVLRTIFHEGLTFAELLGRVKKVTLEAFGHQDVPFEKVVDGLQLERDLSRSPLFQVAFAIQGAAPEFEVGAVKVSPYFVDNGTSKFDLTFLISENNTSIQCWLEYNNELFTEASARGILHHLKTILAYATLNPGARVDEIPLLSEPERLELLQGSGTDLSAPMREQTICSLVDSYSEQRPNAPALVSDGVRLTYRELNERAGKLALRIKSLRLEPAARIGIFLEQGATQVTAALAVLKAGAVFVPLDVEEAPERQSYILADSGISAIIADAKGNERILAKPELPRLLPNDATDHLQAEKSEPQNQVHSVACILYRSGPSGRPEGVLVPQLALLGSTFDSQLNYSAKDRIAQSIRLTHDVAGLHVFAALARGSCVVDLSRKPPLSPREMAELLRYENVSVICASPAELERMARSERSALRKLRLVLFDDHRGLTGAPPAIFQNAGPERQLAVYASAETGSWPLLSPLNQNGSPSHYLSEGARIYILDSRLEPSPCGTVGEIFVASDDLAWGYHQNPERTAERFIPNLFSRLPGARLYRTGDLARRRHDGHIQFLGRRDGRTAISGFRVYVQEIERVLRQHESVQDAAAFLPETEAFREPSIALFVVAAENRTAGREELRHFLEQHLPEVMLPASITVTQAIPRTATDNPDFRVLAAYGKVDQRRLDEKLQHEEYAAPKNRIEEILSGIWARVLRVEKVGIHDNFFRLGGDSILSIQVLARAKQAGIRITPRQMFERQTIADLARVATVLQEAAAEAEESSTGRQAGSDGVTQSDFSLAGLNQEELARLIGGDSDVEDVYSLTPMQEEMLFHSVHKADGAVYFIHMRCRMQGKIDYSCFRQAWEDVIERHAIFRTSFRWEDLKAPVQIVQKHAPLPWREEDWRGLSEQEQQQKWQEFLQQDHRQGLDFLHAPLMRLALFRTGEESQYFVWGFGHILMDGWCVAIVMSEVLKFYEARRAGKKLELDAPPLFRNYIAWLRQQEEKKAEAFWRSELKGFKAATKLRIEREPRQGAKGHGHHRQIRFTLEHATTTKLEELARAHEVTLNAVVQGAWGILLSRYSGDHDVVFGATIAGRAADVRGIDRMVGLFINTLPVRVGVPDHETVAQYLKRLQLRQAEARDVEYAPLVKVQNWSEVPPGSPLFENLMVFENLPVDTMFQQQLAQQITVDGFQLVDLSHYPLVLRITPAKELIFDLIYRTQIYDDKSAERMVDHLKAVLEQMGTRPDGEVGQISLLMQDEYRRLVDDWNQEESDFYEQ